MATDTDRLLLQLDADVTRLTKQMAKASGETTKALKTIEHEAESSMLRLEALFGETKVGEALENVFKRTRFTVLEEGAARIPVFGSALEALGASGLIAAGGLFAFHEAMEKAKEAGEWAEGIEQSASKLGVSMGKMQELDFAGASIGLKPDEMREQLDGVNDLLGKMQAGEPRAKILMQELSFTPAQVQSFKSVADFLPVLAGHLESAGSAAEQANIAKKAGFDRLLPLLREGASGLQRLSDEARRAGIVLDDQTVEGAARLNGKMNEMKAIMGGDLNKAFIDLMPLAVQLAGIMGGLADEVADGVAQMERLAGIRLPGDIKGQQGDLKARIAALQNPSVGGFLTSRHDSLDMLTAGGRSKKLAELQGQLHALNVEDVFEGLDAKINANGGPKARTLIDPKEKRPKRGPEDQTADFDKSATDAYDTALKDAAGAVAALTKGISAHAAAEKTAIDDDTAKKLADLSAQEVKIRASKNDSHRAEQLALLEKAKTETQNAAAAKKELIDREASVKAVEAYNQVQDKINSTMSAIADIRASLATSTSDRNAIERSNLTQNQKRERADFDIETSNNQTLGEYDGVEGQEALAQRQAQRRQMVNLQQAQQDQLTQQQQSPWEQWMQEGVKAGNDVGQALESEAVKGMNDINSGIAEAIANGKNMGDMFKSIFRQMEADAISYLLKQSEVGLFGGSGLGALAGGLFGSAAPQAIANAAGTSTGLLGSLIGMLPHFAAGTDDAPGGLSLVGEKGPELVNLPGGAGVTPNNVLSSIGRLDPSKFMASQMTMNHNVTVDVTGANGDDAIRRIAHEAAAAGTLQAISYSNSKLKNLQRAPSRDLSRF